MAGGDNSASASDGAVAGGTNVTPSYNGKVQKGWDTWVTPDDFFHESDMWTPLGTPNNLIQPRNVPTSDDSDMDYNPAHSMSCPANRNARGVPTFGAGGPLPHPGSGTSADPMDVSHDSDIDDDGNTLGAARQLSMGHGGPLPHPGSGTNADPISLDSEIDDDGNTLGAARQLSMGHAPSDGDVDSEMEMQDDEAGVSEHESDSGFVPPDMVGIGCGDHAPRRLSVDPVSAADPDSDYDPEESDEPAHRSKRARHN